VTARSYEGRTAEEIANDPIVIQTLWLVKNGIPYDIAASLDFVEAKAWAIIFGTFEGGSYDWRSDRWNKRDS
jgi:hypothetical protein